MNGRYVKRLMSLVLSTCAVTMASRSVDVLDGTWRFFQGVATNAFQLDFDDSAWGEVTVPHTWNTDLLEGKGQARGDGWYRYSLTVPESKKGQRLFLRFQAVMLTADVYLNGEKLWTHEGGYAAFAFEITDHICWGKKNLLTVRANNDDHRSIIPKQRLYTLFGGIYRPVALITTDEVCITPMDYAAPGIYLKQENVSEKSADLTITAKISNGLAQPQAVELVATILDADQQVVKTLRQKQTVAPGITPVTINTQIKNPHLWDGLESPYLYRAAVEVVRNGVAVDAVTQPLGFRYFHVDADQGFFLNGKPYMLYGVCAHQDRAVVATAVKPEQVAEDHALIKEIGARAVRLAHYQHTDQAYRICDRNGVVVWAEIPLNSGMPNEAGFKNAEEQLIEMIRQNYNHPSVFFWGLHNELPLKKETVDELHALAKAEDPTRLTVGASNQCTAKSTKENIEPLLGTDLFAFNSYPRWYGGFKTFPEWSAEMQRDFPGTKLGISEYGAGGCIEQQEQNPKRPGSGSTYFPEQYQAEFHEKAWADILAGKHYWCSFVWNMFDFSVERLKRGVRPTFNHKGLVTYDRKTRKDAFWFYKANWSKEPVVYITSRRHINRKNASSDVKVYSNCDEVTLRVNGTSLGVQTGDNCTLVWKNITLKKGENKIEVSGKQDGKSFSDTCLWTLD